LSRNVTAPVGPTPSTVAEKVTGSPKTLGLADERTVVVVGVWACAAAADRSTIAHAAHTTLATLATLKSARPIVPTAAPA
jgi:hypothetical protein